MINVHYYLTLTRDYLESNWHSKFLNYQNKEIDMLIRYEGKLSLGFIYLLYHLCRKWILSFMEIFMIHKNIKNAEKDIVLHVMKYIVVQSPSHSRFFATLWTAASQDSQFPSLPKFMFIATVMRSSHLILWRPLLLLPSIFCSIRDFSNESIVHIRWPKYWSFSFSISPPNEWVFRVDFF